MTLPAWFKQDIPGIGTFELANRFSQSGIHTVCIEAACPNISRCFKEGRATFLILGDTCTRHCSFCNIKKHGSGKLAVDNHEPLRVNEAIRSMGLSYAVITSVTRDDLPDGGASIFARTIELIRGKDGGLEVEALIPDFRGDRASLKLVLDAAPSVLAHNMETVERLYPELRPQAGYRRSLELLDTAKDIIPEAITKSSLMLGLGESEEEVMRVMEDLVESRCDILVMGQYLSPSPRHYPVKEFMRPEAFEKYKEAALDMGFKAVLSSPLARSSYMASEIFRELSYA